MVEYLKFHEIVHIAHIGFEQTLYTTSEMEGSISICISVRTDPVIDRLSIQINVGSNSTQGKYLVYVCLVMV